MYLLDRVAQCHLPQRPQDGAYCPACGRLCMTGEAMGLCMPISLAPVAKLDDDPKGYEYTCPPCGRRWRLWTLGREVWYTGGHPAAFSKLPRADVRVLVAGVPHPACHQTFDFSCRGCGGAVERYKTELVRDTGPSSGFYRDAADDLYYVTEASSPRLDVHVHVCQQCVWRALTFGSPYPRRRGT